MINCQVFLDSLLDLSVKNISVLAHHLLAKSDGFDAIILDAEYDQVLGIESGEHGLCRCEFAL